jgi:methionyl-tRNA formyltransferase
MRETAEAAGIPIEMPESVNSAAAQAYLRKLKSDLLVVCDYGQLLSAETLSLARLGGINLHGSLLPAYRGAAPVNWAIYDGCRETGVTVIHMTPRLDAGPALAKRVLPIKPQENAVELEQRLAVAGVEPILESIHLLATWDGESQLGEQQDTSQATKAPRLKKSDGNVDWNRTAQQIYDQLRAFTPWPGTFTFWHRREGEPVRVVVNEVDPTPHWEPDDQPSPRPPGTVVLSGTRLIIATGSGLLEIIQIQPAGKKPMAANAFLRGYPVAVGDRFGPAS